MAEQEKKGKITIVAKNIKGSAKGKILEESKQTKNVVEGKFYQDGKKGGVNNDKKRDRSFPPSVISYFIFIDSESNTPINGLEIIIKDKDGNIIKQQTNNKGIIGLSRNYKAPFTLLNSRHKEVDKPSKEAQIKAKYSYSDCFTFKKYEEKEPSYVTSLKKINSVKTSKVLLPHAKLEVISGDTLEQYLSASGAKNFDKINKTGYIYDFNWKFPVKDSYYDFDFGEEGVVYIPNQDYDIKNLKDNKCHIFYLTHYSRTSLGQKIIKDLNIVKRSVWSDHSMENFDIIDPKKINSKRSKIEFDWGYNTIVLHNSGNGMEPTIQKLYNKHVVENGWEDIGYHYLIGRKSKSESNIYEGRPLVFKGSHGSKYNSKKIGILIEGDFEYQWWDKDDDLENEQIKLLAKLIYKLKTEIPTIKNLVGHSDVLGKKKDDGCPGEIIHKVMDVFRENFGLSNKIINE
ncbi:peptidoglycan recognition protein family protein [Epilithonimonas caeni]|uniref:peptidoglycan recognition protein family protein n=1 Tax=Epilithonimonas caeni TaxID=365343 RepID=UPI000429E85F|nr:peptidoglycan recognition family protein [Epilithonimonas caeni]